jgi:hypothetical protein
MCPACLVTVSMIVAGVVSTGGVTALAVKSLGRRKVDGGASRRVKASEHNFEKSVEKEKQA